MGGGAKKIVLLGDMAVGKTSLSLRLAENVFSADYVSTIGVKMHKVALDEPIGDADTAILWDTDGEFGEHIFDTVYLKGAAGALIIADVTRPKTIDTMLKLSALFEESLPGRPNLCVLNKCDLREPDDEMYQSISNVSDFVATTSAKSGEGVRAALNRLMGLIDERAEDF